MKLATPDTLKRGDMLELLFDIEKNTLPQVLSQGLKAWKSLDVTYEKPHVERLYWDTEQNDARWPKDIRVYLHRIHACKPEEAFFHPHPWPSAIRLCHGAYVMGLGYRAPHGQDDGTEEPVEAATMALHQGSAYEMIRPHGWHYVRPLLDRSLSVMVTAGRYADPYPVAKKPHDHAPLSKEVQEELLGVFQLLYPRVTK